MNGPARLVICGVLALCPVNHAHAQSTLQQTPVPATTAEHERWYQEGAPVLFAGNMYYPAGAQIHFIGSEMVRSGAYEGIPLYTRTTIEPYSIVYVPLSGGRMQPYERRRDGEIAGTVGSFAPSFPVATSRDVPSTVAPMVEAAGPPMLGPPLVRDAAPAAGNTVTAPAAAAPQSAGSSARTAPQAVGTTGRATTARAAAKPARRPIAIRRTQSQNGIFVDFDRARWFASGEPTALDSTRLTRIGESRGFPVYAARGGDGSTIYLPVAEGVDFVAPYTRRDR